MIVSSQNQTSKPKKEPKKKEQDEILELNQEVQIPSELRPQELAQYIGQKKMISQLKIIIESGKIRDTLPEHILFYGPPGLGKTTIASLIARELNANFKIIAAPGLQKTGDMVSLLVNLEPKTVLFIDEIHRLKAPLEETLYSAMEDGKVDLLMGKGQGASVARLDLSEFILVGATTQLGKLSKPLKDRFPTIFQLEPYQEREILELLDRNTDIIKLNLDTDAKIFIAQRSRGVPRIANNILKRLRDYQIVKKLVKIGLFEAKAFLEELGIHDLGLTKADLKYMQALLSGSVSLKTLGGILLEEVETIELVIEPYLIHLGFIDKSSEGRRLTLKGRDYIEKYVRNGNLKLF